MTEHDVAEFVAWCKGNLDASTASKYIRYLGEVLQFVGNTSVQKVKTKYRGLMPIPTQKSIRILDSESLDCLLSCGYALDDEWWDLVGKTALAVYVHTGLRVSELRLAKLRDFDLQKGYVVVSQPKGKQRWANGREISPIMPGIEALLQAYVKARHEKLESLGLNPLEVEPMFPYISKKGKVSYWDCRVWNKLKAQIELASGIRFQWKELRPTFAQYAKDKGAPIEAISKCLRHTSTRTTELYYARIRDENAFSLVRQAWEAPVEKFNPVRLKISQ
ncbi:MAG: site-specific integrase [Thermoplasmata archaeon]